MLSYFALLLLSLSTLSEAAPHRRATIQDATPAQLQALNATVQGRLFRGVPYGRPCFPNTASNVGGSLDAGQCLQSQAGWKDELEIVKNFGGYQNVNWGMCQRTGDRCDLDFNLPQNPLAYAPLRQCKQGSIPTYYIDVRQQSDIQAALAFSRNTSIPVVVKTSGHDCIWMHNYQYTKFLPSASFCGAAAGPVIQHGAGVPFIGVYEFAEKNNVTYVGGSAMTVTPGGGWLSGGGHSSISNKFGLGVDRVQQMTIVTPKGEIVTASRCQNAELFYALRGSGGGVFGVATDIWMSVVPRLTLQTLYVKFIGLSPSASSDFLKVAIDTAVSWGKAGAGGYIAPAAMTKQASGLIITTPGITLAEARALYKPMTDFASKLGNVAINNEVSTQSSFLEFYTKFIKPNEELVGLGVAIASRFVQDTNFATNASRAELLAAMNKGIAMTPTNVLGVEQSLAPYGGPPVQILVTSPYNFKDDGTSSVTPAWRNTLWHVLFAPTWSYNTGPESISKLWHQANDAAQVIRDITPNSGAYQNEASIFEPNPAQSFWGTTNFNRLTALKKQYDPQNILTCHNCIGYVASDARYQCYPQ